MEVEQQGIYSAADVERMFRQHVRYVPVFKTGELHVIAHMLGVAYEKGVHDGRSARKQKYMKPRVVL